MKKSNLKIGFIILIITLLNLFTLNCKNTNEPTETPVKTESTKDTVQTEQSQTIVLADKIFNLEAFTEEEMETGQVLNFEDYKKWQLEKVDTVYQWNGSPDMKYYLLKEYYKGKQGKINLFVRMSENENYAWLVSYTNQNEFVGFLTVFYDEWAESAHGISTEIKDGTIRQEEFQLNFETGDEETKTTFFKPNQKLNFEKISAGRSS